ncbi:MAG: NUDIX hydrolase [Anaerolineaceae bacterium]|nr:NUDIX hydrolase [Anaerolineaceae bacterium]
MTDWKTLKRELILDRGKFLRVEEHCVELPDGATIDDWMWVITPDFINVIAEREDGRFLFFRQSKYAIDGLSIAPVGGYIEPGEEPLAAAKRELMEETGYEAPDWQFLGTYAVDANRGSGNGNFFLARGAVKVAEADADDLEEQELILLTRAEMESALLEAKIKVLPWMAITGLALRVLDAENGDGTGIND